MQYQYKVLRKDVCYQGFFRLERYRIRHELFAGGWSDEIVRELLERGHAAAVLPYDPEGDSVVMIEQFRIGAMQTPTGPWLLEFVAGIIDPDEEPEQVVVREALEEMGSEVTDLVPILAYHVSPGGCSERIHLFCGRVDARLTGGVHGIAEEGEDIRVRVLLFEEAFALLNAGKITSATAIIALQWLALNRERLRVRWGG